MLTRAFDCRVLKENVIRFAVNNLQALRQKGLLVQLDSEDQLLIKKAIQINK